MFSTLLSIYGKCTYPLYDTCLLANNTLPLSIAEKQRQPFPVIENGPIYEPWNDFSSESPKRKAIRAVTLVHGFLPTCSAALGTFLFKHSPKVVAVDIAVESIDPKAAMFLCKHEFAHIMHNDALKQFVPLLIINIAASFFCASWYTPLLIGMATHTIANKILGLRAEINADRFAIEHATEKELKGAVRFFEAHIQFENQLCPPNSFCNKVKRFAKELFDTHPSNSYRLNKVEEALKTRFNYSKIKLDKIKEKNRVWKLKEYAVFRATTPTTDPQFQQKVTEVLERLEVRPF